MLGLFFLQVPYREYPILRGCDVQRYQHRAGGVWQQAVQLLRAIPRYRLQATAPCSADMS